MQQLKTAQAASLLYGMPVTGSQLKALFEYLDGKLSEQGCDDTLYHTAQFAVEAGVSFANLKAWLETEGGYCDCEVIANVEEKFEGLV
jgi:hypothetical protein